MKKLPYKLRFSAHIACMACANVRVGQINAPFVEVAEDLQSGADSHCLHLLSRGRSLRFICSRHLLHLIARFTHFMELRLELFLLKFERADLKPDRLVLLLRSVALLNDCVYNASKGEAGEEGVDRAKRVADLAEPLDYRCVSCTGPPPEPDANYNRGSCDGNQRTRTGRAPLSCLRLAHCRGSITRLPSPRRLLGTILRGKPSLGFTLITHDKVCIVCM